LLKAIKQFISDLANKSVVVLILHVDDELPVTILEGLDDGLDVLDLDGPFKLVGLNVSKLVRGQEQVALLAHLETVVLQQFAREHHSFSGVQIAHDILLVTQVQVIMAYGEDLDVLLLLAGRR
jgi:hypothetical protein